jgi:hypothetical protein
MEADAKSRAGAVRDVAGERAPTRIQPQLGVLAATALLLALAALPRVSNLSDFFTTDEAYHWVARTERFNAAIAAGRWDGTVLTGHPGVTNMWLGSVGLTLERWLVGAGLVARPSAIEHLAWLRLPGALLQTLLVPVAFLLLRRLVAPTTALVASTLWALSPFLVAHSRLLHLDALLTSFVTFSLLLLLDGGQRAEGRGQRARWRSLLPSGVFAGLALLTKGPALILLPFAGLVVVFAGSRQQAEGGWREALFERLRRAMACYAIWIAAALATVLLLWPALWADPGDALGRYVGEIATNGGRPNGDGQFFLGQAVDDPGPLFYLAANAFRTTPLMLLGLVAALVVALRQLRRKRTTHAQTGESHELDEWTRIRAHSSNSWLSRSETRTLLWLLAFVLFWTLVMTAGPKKFDRYVLPTWPALCVLAAYGLVQLANGVRQLGANRGVRVVQLGAALALAAEISQPLGHHPHALSYYNPLLGGGVAAQHTFLIGWGEGMEQVGAWLSARPDIGHGPVLSALGRTLQPFVPVDVRDVDELGQIPANYAVVYLESLQRGANPAAYAAIQQTVPLHQVVIHGIEYARIYQLPRPFATPLGAQFGETLHLPGVTVEPAPGRLTVTPAWDVRARPAADYVAFLHLLDANGQRVAQVDVRPGGGGAPPTSAWQAGEQIGVPLPLDLPAGLPPGEYTLVLGVYDEATGERLPLTHGQQADPALAGADALLVQTVELR